MLSLQKSHENFSKYYDRPESVKARHYFRTTTTNYVMLAVSKILFMHSIFAAMIAKGEGEGLSCKRSTVTLLHLVISSTLSPSYTGRRRPPQKLPTGAPPLVPAHTPIMYSEVEALKLTQLTFSSSNS